MNQHMLKAKWKNEKAVANKEAMVRNYRKTTMTEILQGEWKNKKAIIEKGEAR